MKRFLLAIAVLTGTAAGAAPAWADLQYKLNCDSTPTCNSSNNFGTVTLHQTSSTKVTVTVQLLSTEHFVTTNAGYAIAFDIKNNPALDVVDGIKVNTTLTPNASLFTPEAWTSGQTYKAAPFTSGANNQFNYAIDYTGGNSGSDRLLVFDVNLSTGILLTDFVGNPTYRFAVDMLSPICPAGNTCNVGSNSSGTEVPEPSSWTISIAGLMGLMGFALIQRRRRVFARAL